jgi:alcohol dehydrogenase class IV
MWFFNSPQIVFGECSLDYLDNLQGERACVITDENLLRLGYVDRIRSQLSNAGIETRIFSKIEPDPSLKTVSAGAAFLQGFAPDWIVALGGGSVIDAAKAMWVLYELPETMPEAINPVETLGLRRKAHFAAIPTTAGTGSEATWAIVLTDQAERRKLALGNREVLPDLTILDPDMVKELPPQLTADTGMDALTHAIEGYTCTWRNDISDGLCLKAIQLIFDFLPRAHQHGAGDMEARTRMQNAATIAGLGFGNANAALAHAMGHSLGAIFHVPHGRAVGLFLPYTIEYCLGGEPDSTRYVEIARFLGLPATDERLAGEGLVAAIRTLARSIAQPLTLQDCGISQEDFERELDAVVMNAMNDTTCLMSTRIPEDDEMRKLFDVAFHGSPVDF